MRVFISHTFKDADKSLATMLKEELDAIGIDGYLAEKTLRYDLRIHDKIRRAIDESDCLVAIITHTAQESPSVHEEIGYVLGRGIEPIIMLEEGVKEAGVLVYGKEPEVFRVSEFRMHAQRVAKFIKEAPQPKAPEPERLGRDAERLLSDRKILSEKLDDFAQNRHFDSLYVGALTDDETPIPYDIAGLAVHGLYVGALTDAEKPVVLFTACPHKLASCNIVTTNEFKEWAKGIEHVYAEGHRIPIRGLDDTIDIESLTIIEKQADAPSNQDVRSYREFQDNGFFECGSLLPYVDRNHRDELYLHLCSLIGNFWGFLLHTRLFYQRIDLEGPFTVLLSIRNSSELALGNYGDESTDPKWRYARRTPFSPGDPRTDRRHIRLAHAFGSVHEMTDQEIAGAARDAARKICNAYGQSSPNCYSSDGRFSWGQWRTVQL